MLRFAIPTGFAIGALGVVLAGACGGNVVAGSGASTSGSTSPSAGGSGTSTSSTGATSTTGPGMCKCGLGFVCCGGECVNPQNDILNCGGCGMKCGGPHPYCDNGKCGVAPCTTTACTGTDFCCDTQCCSAGELCCAVQAGPTQIKCQAPNPMMGSCDPGCPSCLCASPDTPIATPSGERPITELAAGDRVYSVDRGAVVAVPVLRTSRTPAHHHHVVRVLLASGVVLEVSPRHPTADGRTFGDLRAGGVLDGHDILSAELVPYAHPFTYDILPASETRAYYAGGVLIGTTLVP
jgi:hypothetical protein